MDVIALEPDFILQTLRIVIVGVLLALFAVGLARLLLDHVHAHDEVGVGTHSL
jgi:hypothetical protein